MVGWFHHRQPDLLVTLRAQLQLGLLDEQLGIAAVR
jgi:hypothetical protein